MPVKEEISSLSALQLEGLLYTLLMEKEKKNLDLPLDSTLSKAKYKEE